MEHTVEEVTLSSGTKGLLIDVPGTAVVDFRLSFNAGYQFADRTTYEVPHLIEHHILNATKSHPRFGQIQTEMGKNGAVTNAMTSANYIAYVATAPADDALRVLALTGEVLTEPLFPATQYETERENVRSELSDKTSNYGLMASMLLSEQSYPQQIMEYRTRIQQLSAITHQDVVGHYHKTHLAQNGNFIVAGPIQARQNELIRHLEAIYSGLPRGARLKLATDMGLRVDQPVVWQRDIEAVHFVIEWYAPGGDAKENVAHKLLHMLLTDGKESRIFGVARDQGLTYYLHSSGGSDPYEASGSIAGHAVPAKLSALYRLIGEATSRIVSEVPSRAEVVAVQNRLKGLMAISNQTVGSIARWYTPRYCFDGSIQAYGAFIDLIDRVTPEDIQSAAQKIFQSDRHATSCVGPVSQSQMNDWTQALQLV